MYSTLLFHANGLITVLGEFLECVSGIQRLVGTLKTQRTSIDYERETGHGTNALSRDYSIADEQISMAEFIADEPRPIKVLDHNLARKLKRKTKFKTIADKVRRSFTDFAKRSTTSLLTIFPPLGDGTNDGFLDLYSDGEYDSDYVAGTDITESIYDDEDTYSRTLSPPASPGVMLDKHRQRHRRLSSKDSSGPPEQYWPGSIKLGTSDGNQSPVKVASGMILGPHDMAMSRSMSSERTIDSISTRFNLGSPTGPSVARNSLDSLRESQETVAPLPVYTFDAQVPPLTTLKPDTNEKRQSLLFRRRNSVQVSLHCRVYFILLHQQILVTHGRSPYRFY